MPARIYPNLIDSDTSCRELTLSVAWIFMKQRRWATGRIGRGFHPPPRAGHLSGA